MTSGYSKTPLAKKLGIKDGQLILVINEPGYYGSLFDTFPEVTVAKQNENELDFIHLFVSTLEELALQFEKRKKQLKKTGALWVSWPKKAAKMKTDLDGNIVRHYGLEKGLVDVKVCAIDETWSGLKFMYRVKDR